MEFNIFEVNEILSPPFLTLDFSQNSLKIIIIFLKKEF